MPNQKERKDIKVLIASDSKHFVTLIRQGLTAGGITMISEVDNSHKALNELTLRIPDVMVISWNFKPLSGIDFCRTIRCNPQSPARYLPIIIANEFSDKKQIVMARDVGINDLLLVPFSANNLINKVLYVIENPRPFIETADYFGPDRRRKEDPNYKGQERRKKVKGMTPEQISALLMKK